MIGIRNKSKENEYALPLDKRVEEVQTCSPNIQRNEAYIQQVFAKSADVRTQKLHSEDGSDVKGMIVYCDQLCDTKQMNEEILPALRAHLHRIPVLSAKTLETCLNVAGMSIEKDLSAIQEKVFSGEAVLFADGLDEYVSLDLAHPPQRSPEEPNTDISIRGPRDGFVEELSINVSLIRKRLRTPSLCYEKFTIGKRSRTQVGLLYMKDIVRPEVIEGLKQKLNQIKIDVIVSPVELEDLITSNPLTPFPLMNYTGRPDFAVASLVRGRFVVIVDGTPTPLIAPTNLWFLLKTPEDLHTNYLYVSFERLFRMFGLLISLFLPGFYVAITTYHQDQIPLTLLATLVESRKGIPFPTPLDTFLVLTLFELFREAGSRLPSVLGPTLAVVGGLIIGQSAIEAGLVSPALLVMAGITAVSTFSLVNQTLSGTVSLIRLVVIFFASLFGIFGFFLCLFIVMVYLANLQSFGISYLAPISPLSWKDIGRGIFQLPAALVRYRPQMLHTKDADRQDRNDDE